MENNIITVFNNWKLQGTEIIELLNKEQQVVAALYLNRLNIDSAAVCETTKISERYYLYLDGIAVFFTSYRKLDK